MDRKPLLKENLSLEKKNLLMKENSTLNENQLFKENLHLSKIFFSKKWKKQPLQKKNFFLHKKSFRKKSNLYSQKKLSRKKACDHKKDPKTFVKKAF